MLCVDPAIGAVLEVDEGVLKVGNFDVVHGERVATANDPKLSDCGGRARRLRKGGWGRRRWEQPA